MAARAAAADTNFRSSAPAVAGGRAEARYDWLLECRARRLRSAASHRAWPFAVLAAHPQRIVVLGDTGCRLKGAALQACNDPAQWPFPQLAAAAASLKPDLVIHVGDYLYRESACPAGKPGLRRLALGRQLDDLAGGFLHPRRAACWRPRPSFWRAAITRTASAPVPAGLRLQGPAAFDPPRPARRISRSITVDLGDLTLAVLDDAVSDETDLDRDTAKIYADEIGRSGQAARAGLVRAITARPGRR